MEIVKRLDFNLMTNYLLFGHVHIIHDRNVYQCDITHDKLSCKIDYSNLRPKNWSSDKLHIAAPLILLATFISHFVIRM